MVQERLVEHLVTEDDRVLVSIVERWMKSGRLVYYGRFKINKRELANDQMFIVRSLRTDNLTSARHRAYKLHADFEIRQDSETPLTELTVSDCIDQFLKNYERGLNAQASGYTLPMFKGYKKNIDIYWREYFEGRPINSVSMSDLEEYEAWRQNWAKSTSRKRKNDQRYKEKIAKRTIAWEINAFKTVLRWSASKNFYNGRAYEWRYSAGTKNRRSAFTDQQFRKLYEYMNSEDFLQVGKHGFDKRIQRHRRMLRAYIMFLAHTGLRVGEARHLKWSDVSKRVNKLGKDVVLVRVSKDHSKVGKVRNVVGDLRALRALQYWKDFLSDDIGEAYDSELFWEDDAELDRFIFCDENGKAINDFRAGFNSIIKEADVEFDADGNKLVLYSLRHTYITRMIQYKKDLSLYSLAQNCGTSVAMIEQFYSDAVSEDFVDELSI